MQHLPPNYPECPGDNLEVVACSPLSTIRCFLEDRVKTTFLKMKEYDFVPAPEGDVSQGWALLSVTWAFVLFASITTIIRVIVRARLTRNLGADDYCIVAAIVLNPLSFFYVLALGNIYNRSNGADICSGNDSCRGRLS